MDRPNTRKAPLRVQAGLWDNVRVVDSKPGDFDELALEENSNCGGDPYNSTGQHVILELQKDDDGPEKEDSGE